MLTLRGVVHDIGRSIIHKVKIINMYTQNYSAKDIARATSHAPSSVNKYIRDFQRVKIFCGRGMILSEIAYITRYMRTYLLNMLKLSKNRC